MDLHPAMLPFIHDIVVLITYALSILPYKFFHKQTMTLAPEIFFEKSILVKLFAKEEMLIFTAIF